MSHYRLNLFIQPEHAKRLEELAAKKGVSKSSIVAAALASWLSPDAGDQREAAIAKLYLAEAARRPNVFTANINRAFCPARPVCHAVPRAAPAVRTSSVSRVRSNASRDSGCVSKPSAR